MKITNKEIYEYAQRLAIFNTCNIKIPVKLNFYIQKNIQKIYEAAHEIESIKFNLCNSYGTLNEEKDKYIISPDKIEEFNQELKDLFNLIQELDIHMFKLNEFDGIELEYQQMSAIMFMIEE